MVLVHPEDALSRFKTLLHVLARLIVLKLGKMVVPGLPSSQPIKCFRGTIVANGELLRATLENSTSEEQY